MPNIKSHSSIWIVIPCAGSGSRMQSKEPKQYLPFAGATLLQTVVQRFLDRKDVVKVILATDDVDRVNVFFKAQSRVDVVGGGETRLHSVFNALLFLRDKVESEDLIAVHDAARPCIRQSMLDHLFKEAQSGAVILAEPCVQTVKQGALDTGIQRTLSRETLFFAQTPQVFQFSLLFKALTHSIDKSIEVTDDASAVECLGYPIKIVQGSSENLKITYPSDWLIADVLYQAILEDND